MPIKTNRGDYNHDRVLKRQVLTEVDGDMGPHIRALREERWTRKRYVVVRNFKHYVSDNPDDVGNNGIDGWYRDVKS